MAVRGIGQPDDSPISKSAMLIATACAVVSKEPAYARTFQDPYAAWFAAAISQEAAARLPTLDDPTVRAAFIKETERDLDGLVTHVVYRKPWITARVREVLKAGCEQFLTPPWLATNIFQRPAGAEIPVQIEVRPAGGVPPRFTMEGVTITPTRDHLILSPAEFSPASLDLLDTTATRILDALPHTPIRAFGQNLEFLEDAPSEEALQLFTARNDLDDRLSFRFETRSRSTSSAISFVKTKIRSNGQCQMMFASPAENGQERNFSRVPESGGWTVLSTPFLTFALADRGHPLIRPQRFGRAVDVPASAALVLGDDLRAEQQQKRGDFKAQEDDDRRGERSVHHLDL